MRRRTRDPDGNALTYSWFFYPEAGTGIPGQPVSSGGLAPRRRAGAGGIPPSARRRSAAARAARDARARATRARDVVTPRVAGVAHVILAVEDDGTPTLTSYRRVIVTIK